MLVEADVIVIAKLVHKEGVWSLKLKEVLKGDFLPNEVVCLSSELPQDIFNFERLLTYVEDSDFLFLGHFVTESKTLQPRWGICCAWPQGTVKALLPQRTLAEVIIYAKKELGLPLDGQDSTAIQPVSPSSEPSRAFISFPYDGTGWIGWCLIALGVICLAWLFRWLRKP